MSIKKHFTKWSPPGSKHMELTEMDSLITPGVVDFVEKYYYSGVRYVKRRKFSISGVVSPSTSFDNVELPLPYYEKGSRINDEKNNSDAKYEIHNFGCSWTYGWCLPVEESFPHLLIEDNVASFNYGAGRTGLDYAVKKASEVYHKRNHRENQNFVYVITIPHTFRRMWFEDNGMARRCIEKPTAAGINEYNHYLYFLHHYEMLNRFVGKDRIIWGTWDTEVPEDKLDVFFQLHDTAGDGRHPGVESHKIYAEQVKDIIKQRGLFSE
jgi:hypothetical protein